MLSRVDQLEVDEEDDGGENKVGAGKVYVADGVLHEAQGLVLGGQRVLVGLLGRLVGAREGGQASDVAGGTQARLDEVGHVRGRDGDQGVLQQRVDSAEGDEVEEGIPVGRVERNELGAQALGDCESVSGRDGVEGVSVQ